MEEKFCDLIKRLRSEKNMSIDELAQKANLTSVEIRNIEKGTNKPQVARLKMLADALDYDYYDLFDVYSK